MRGYRLSRSLYASYDGEGARRAGGRWNSKGTRVLYLSENRALCVLEVLVPLSDTLSDKYVLGARRNSPNPLLRDYPEHGHVLRRTRFFRARTARGTVPGNFDFGKL